MMATPAAALAAQGAGQTAVRIASSVWAALEKPLVEGGGNTRVTHSVSKKTGKERWDVKVEPRWSVPAWVPVGLLALYLVDVEVTKVIQGFGNGLDAGTSLITDAAGNTVKVVDNIIGYEVGFYSSIGNDVRKALGGIKL